MSKRLSISWLQSPSAVTLELKKIESLTVSIFPIYYTLVGILKARILVVRFKPFTPQGEARSWGVSSQLYGNISREFIVRTFLSLSYLFILMWVFSHSSDVRELLN